MHWPRVCLLINAAECEPGIACDEALLLHDTEATIHGINALNDLVQADTTRIAIESDKSRAIAALENGLANNVGATLLRIQPVYPSGAERALVNLALKLQQLAPLDDHEHPTDRGIICVNLATAHAAGQAARGLPVTHRVITVNGPSPCHARVARGTPIQHVLKHTGNLPRGKQRLRIGGPLSGFDVADNNTPVTTMVNAITVTDPPCRTTAQACIRCGDCAPVCPSGLYPHLLLELAQDDAGLDRQGFDRCITCGCCDIACPSHIPLTAEFRKAFARRTLENMADNDAREAERLHERHRARKQRDTLRTPAEPTPANNKIAAALERVRARRKPSR